MPRILQASNEGGLCCQLPIGWFVHEEVVMTDSSIHNLSAQTMTL